MGIAAAIPALAQELDQIELVPLAEKPGSDDSGDARPYGAQPGGGADEPAAPDELLPFATTSIATSQAGSLGEARRELLRRMLEERELYDAEMRKLQVLCWNGLLDVDVSPEVHMEGASNLLGLDLRLTREKLRELLSALEEKKRVIELLDRFLDQPAGELEVHVGLERAHPAMKDLALIGMTVRLASGLPAKVAVLGPERMHYERVMAAVLQTSRALESARF